MKRILFSCLFFAGVSAHAQHKLEKLWQTDSVVAVPESVAGDFDKGLLYVSLIEGEPWGVDGKGGVATLGVGGTPYDSSWITGLNAPKGLGIYGNTVYAADISEVAVIDRLHGKLIKKIPVPGATGLNDIAVSPDGTVYVSDSKTSKIWKIVNDNPVLFLDSVTGANGLETYKNDVIYAKGKDLMKIDPKKKISKIGTVMQGIDGIDAVGNGDFIVSSWSGHIYYVQANGMVETLLDTEAEKMNTADIVFDPAKKIVYVPTFFAKKIVAYKLL